MLNRKFINLQTIINPQTIRAMNKQRSSGKSDTGAPIFPGTGSGLTVEQIRELISQQPRQTGYTVNVSAGENILDNLKLPGDSRLLLGINWNATQITTATDTYTLTVNNNKIIDTVSILLNSTQTGGGGMAYSDDPYIPLLQPLSGSDNLEIVYNAGANGTIQLVLWYI